MIKKTIQNALLHFFENAPHPSCDPTTIPYAIGLHHAGIKDCDIIDGSRNDIYFSWVPTREYNALSSYYQLLGGGWRVAKTLRHQIPFHSKANKFFSNFPEVNLYKHGHLRRRETQNFFPHSTDTETFWLDLYKSQNHRSIWDMRNFIMGQYFEGCGIAVKAQMVAQSLNANAVMPWSNPDLAEYVFNLPQSAKYNAKARTNKTLLRQMLKERVDYDAAAIGKRIFYFNMQKFVLEHIDFVREEILNCKLWQPAIENRIKHLSKNPKNQTPRRRCHHGYLHGFRLAQPL